MSSLTTALNTRYNTPGLNNNKGVLSQIRERGVINWAKENPKNAVNFSTNFSAALANGVSFVLANLFESEGLNYVAEKLSFGLTKLSTVSSGIIGTKNGLNEGNTLNLIGSALELPVSLVPGHDLWLYRGFPLFGQNCRPIFNSLGVRTENGERNNSKAFSSLFSKDSGISSFWKNIKLMFSEIPHILSELGKEPAKFLKSSPHVVMMSTIGQAIGSTIAALGFKKLGAGVRNISGIGVDVGLALHKEYDIDGKPKNKTTNYFVSGITWGGAAVIDFFKRFDFISDKIKGLSYLEYFLDRFANAYFVNGDDPVIEKNQEVKHPQAAIPDSGNIATSQIPSRTLRTAFS